MAGNLSKARIQAVLQGHASRSQIVHQVRREYEKTVEQLEGDLLGHGSVIWRHPYHLCLPQHVYSVEGRQEFSQTPPEDRSSTQNGDRMSDSRVSDKDEMEESDEKEQVEEQDEKDSENEEEVTESTDGHSNVSQLSTEHTLLKPNLDLSEITIPNDKKELLKLRSQLAMELVWVKQAISSRQQYLILKKQLEAEEEERTKTL